MTHYFYSGKSKISLLPFHFFVSFRSNLNLFNQKFIVMKKIYLILCLALFYMPAQSQFLMKSNSHMLRAGDQHYFNITNNVDPGYSGPNQIWDFSGLVKKSTLTSYMYSSFDTPNYTDIPESDAVLEEFGNKFYFKVTDELIEQYGTVTNGTITKYDKPFVKMVFPFNYGDVYSGDFSGTIAGKNNYTATFTGTYLLEADAFGTLLLPNGIMIKDVIRIKTVKEQCYNNSVSCNCATISYKWYSQDLRYPLLTNIQSKNSQGVKTIQTAYYSKAENKIEEKTERLNALSETIQATLYPNPFSREFKMDYSIAIDSDVVIEIYDNSGVKVYDTKKMNQKAGKYTEEINANQIGNQLGIFHIRIIAGDSSISKTVIRGE